jgi:hypothetical protein
MPLAAYPSAPVRGTYYYCLTALAVPQIQEVLLVLYSCPDIHLFLSIARRIASAWKRAARWRRMVRLRPDPHIVAPVGIITRECVWRNMLSCPLVSHCSALVPHGAPRLPPSVQDSAPRRCFPWFADLPRPG